MDDNEKQTNDTQQKDNNSVQNKQSNDISDKFKKIVSKASKMNAAKASLVHALLPIIMGVGILIFIIVILVGIIVFFITMPGMVMDQIKEFASSVGNAVASFFGQNKAEQIEEKDIFNTLSYLENMGYDLKGYGFLTGYLETQEDVDDYGSNIDDSEGINIDADVGVVRDDNDNIIAAESDFIIAYLVSDKYAYTVKNSNIVSSNFITGLFKEIASFISFGQLDEYWTKGMLSIYNEGSRGIGDEGLYYTDLQFGSIKIDAENETMEINDSLLGLFDNSMTYNLNGWTGRYGMPIDFLLSIHIATMMPDLAYDMATSFETEIRLVLHSASGKASASYGDISYTEFEDYASTTALDSWTISSSEAKKIMDELGIKSPDNCQYLKDLDKEVEDTVNQVVTDPQSNEDKLIDLYKGMIDKMVSYGFELNDSSGLKDKISGFSDFESLLNEKNGNTKLFSKKIEWDGEFDGSSCVYYAEISLKYTNALETGGAVQSNLATIYYSIKREPTDEELDEILNDAGLTDKSEIKCSDSPDEDECCSVCRRYVQKIYKSLRKANEKDFNTYIPYISRVIHHWYRDVYFVLDNDFIGDGYEEVDSFVEYDYEYEALTGERWTLYETYTDDPSDGDLCQPDKKGEFVYYVLNDDGSTGERYEGEVDTSKKTIVNENGETEEVRYGNVGEDGTVVVKKAKTISVSDKEALEDLGWSKNESSSIWTAYAEENDTSTGKQRAYDDSEIEDESDVDKEIDSNVNVEITWDSGNLVQVGEGQRAETNSKIKKIFLENTYFRYDGSAKTAEIITALREQNDIEYGALTEDDLSKTVTIDDETYKVEDYAGNVSLEQDSLNAFSMLENEHTLDADYIYRDFKELIVELGYYTKEELTDDTPRLLQWIVPDISSYGYPDRTIDKNEMGAGTAIHSKGDIEANEKNTLAAAIELAVTDEKEEDDDDDDGLTDDIEDLLKDEKEEDDDIDDEDNKDDDDGVEVDKNGKTKSKSVSGISETDNNSDDTSDTLTVESNESLTSVGSTDVSKSSTNNKSSADLLSLDEWWEKLQEMYDVFQSEGWTYAQDHSCTTFEKAQSSKHTADCSLMVSWALQKLGALEEGTVFSSALGSSGSLSSGDAAKQLKNAGAEVIKVNETIKTAVDNGDLQPGDILFFKGHVNIYCGDSYEKGGTYYCWDAGSTKQIQYGGPKNKENKSSKIKLIIRLPVGTSSGAGDEYEGYEGNEAVVSPVTGVLLEYGEVDRENVDLKYGTSYLDNTDDTEGDDENPSENPEATGETIVDKVGYAKILVLDEENYKLLEDYLISNAGNIKSETGEESLINQYGNYVEIESLTEDTIEDWSDLEKNLYAYKEFAELYEEYGISGYTVTITGFKCELPDEEFDIASQDEEKPDGEDLTLSNFQKITTSSFNSSGELTADEEDMMESRYEADEEYDFPSEKVTNRLNTENKLKDEALSTITVNGITLIKEGTILGRTVTDKEVVEDYADGARGEYTDYRKSSSSDKQTTPDDPDEKDKNDETEEEENLDKVVGNYLNVCMQNVKGEAVEDVEDYMKLDEDGGSSTQSVSQEYQAWSGDLEALAEAMWHESGSSVLPDSKLTQEVKDFEIYCQGYSIVNKLLEVNKDTNYGKLYDESKTDKSPLVQVLTSAWYGDPIPNEVEKVHNGGSGCYSPEMLEYAEYCLTYDCTSVTKPYDTQLSAYAISKGYTKTTQGTVIPRAMCQQGQYGDGASGQDKIILVGYWDSNDNNVFDKGDELWGVDRDMESRLADDNVTQD